MKKVDYENERVQIDIESLRELVHKHCIGAGLSPSEMIMALSTLLAVESFEHAKPGTEQMAIDQAIRLVREVHDLCMADITPETAH